MFSRGYAGIQIVSIRFALIASAWSAACPPMRSAAANSLPWLPTKDNAVKPVRLLVRRPKRGEVTPPQRKRAQAESRCRHVPPQGSRAAGCCELRSRLHANHAFHPDAVAVRSALYAMRLRNKSRTNRGGVLWARNLASCARAADGPHEGREVGEGRTARQPGQVRKEAALTRQGGSLSNLPPSPPPLLPSGEGRRRTPDLIRGPHEGYSAIRRLSISASMDFAIQSPHPSRRIKSGGSATPSPRGRRGFPTSG